VKPGRKRKLVDEICGEWQVSIRRAREALEFDRSTYLCLSEIKLAHTDDEVRQEMA
jgi:putative transposase